MTRYDLSQTEVNNYFRILEKLLKLRQLPNDKGEKRYVSADEFMLMHEDNNGVRVGFKHHDTRNYVYIHRDFEGDYFLQVPTTPDAFHRGYF